MSLPDVTVRVLLVEDEHLIRGILQETLQDGGYQVICARSTDEALPLLDGVAAEIGGLITDVNLGGPQSGWDVARRARELNPRLPVIYMSGDSGFEWSSRGVPNSVMVTKPFAPAQLVVALAGLGTRSDKSF
jgi:DNA-binding response OmpR family regulator